VLHEAAREGNVDVVKLLVALGADINAVGPFSGGTALEEAGIEAAVAFGNADY